MSRVTYSPFGPSAPRSLSKANSILAAIAAASADVNPRNLAEEGLDQQAIVVGAHGGRLARVAPDIARTVLAPQSMGPLPGGLALRASDLGTIPAASAVRLRAWISCQSTFSDGQGVPPGTYEFRFARSTGGVASEVPGSRMKRVQRSLPAYARHGDFLWEAWIRGPFDDLAFVEVQFAGTGGSLRVDHINLTVDEFRRLRFV